MILIEKKEDNDSQTDEKAASSEVGNKNKKSKKGLIIGIIVFLLVVGGATLAWVVSTPSNVKVPNVANMTQSEAESAIKKADLKVGAIRKDSSSDVAKNKVTRTDPTSRTYVRTGSKVNIYISQGGNSFKMKNYVGKNYQDAKDELVIKYNVSENQITSKTVASKQAAGTVISQTPKEGDYFDLDGNDQIVLEVSEGAQGVMPEFKNRTWKQVKADLISIGVPEENIILDQQPNTGYSNGENYVGKNYQDAKDELVIKYNVSENQITSKTVASKQAAGTVISQTPKEGDYFDLDGNDQIVLEVSEGAQGVMPEFKNRTWKQVKADLISIGVPEENIILDQQPNTGYSNGENYVYDSNVAAGQSFNIATQQITLTYLGPYQPTSTESSSTPQSTTTESSSTPQSTTSETSSSPISTPQSTNNSGDSSNNKENSTTTPSS